MAFVLTNSPKEFIPSTQLDQENPLTFICIPPSRMTVLNLQEKILKSVSAEEEIETLDLPIADMMDLYLDACVTGWKNMTDADGKEVEFTKEAFKGFNDMQILMELYSFVKELAESTEKN